MSFGKELKDFVEGYKTGSDILDKQAQRKLEQERYGSPTDAQLGTGQPLAGTAPAIPEAGAGAGGDGKVDNDTAQVAGRLKGDLMRDFKLNDIEAGGIVASLAAESGGFKQLQELSPTVAGSKGGWGYAQWTGPRRDQFNAFAQKNGFDPKSYEANYGFLKNELQGPEGKILDSLRGAKDIRSATQTFTGSAASKSGFLRPGTPNMAGRFSWADRIAGIQPQTATASAAPAAAAPAPAPAATAEAKPAEPQKQARLSPAAGIAIPENQVAQAQPALVRPEEEWGQQPLFAAEGGVIPEPVVNPSAVNGADRYNRTRDYTQQIPQSAPSAPARRIGTPTPGSTAYQPMQMTNGMTPSQLAFKQMRDRAAVQPAAPAPVAAAPAAPAPRAQGFAGQMVYQPGAHSRDTYMQIGMPSQYGQSSGRQFRYEEGGVIPEVNFARGGVVPDRDTRFKELLRQESSQGDRGGGESPRDRAARRLSAEEGRASSTAYKAHSEYWQKPKSVPGKKAAPSREKTSSTGKPNTTLGGTPTAGYEPKPVGPGGTPLPPSPVGPGGTPLPPSPVGPGGTPLPPSPVGPGGTPLPPSPVGPGGTPTGGYDQPVIAGRPDAPLPNPDRPMRHAPISSVPEGRPDAPIPPNGTQAQRYRQDIHEAIPSLPIVESPGSPTGPYPPRPEAPVAPNTEQGGNYPDVPPQDWSGVQDQRAIIGRNLLSPLLNETGKRLFGYADGGIIPEPGQPGYNEAVAGGATAQAPVDQQPTGPQERMQPTPKLMSDVSKALHHGIGYLTQHFGLKQDGAVPTPDGGQAQQDGARRFAEGEGAASQQEVDAIDDKIDPNREMSEGDRQMTRSAKVVQWYLAHGRKDDAGAAAAGLMQYGAQRFGQIGSIGAAAYRKYLQSGDPKDLEATTNALKSAYSMIPDGGAMDVQMDPRTHQLVVSHTDDQGNTTNLPVKPEDLPGIIKSVQDKSAYWQQVMTLADPEGAHARDRNAASTAEWNRQHGVERGEKLSDAEIKRQQDVSDAETKRQQDLADAAAKTAAEAEKTATERRQKLSDTAATNTEENKRALRDAAIRRAEKSLEGKNVNFDVVNPLINAATDAANADDADSDAGKARINEAQSRLFDALPEANRIKTFADLGYDRSTMQYVPKAAQGATPMPATSDTPPKEYPGAKKGKDRQGNPIWVIEKDGKQFAVPVS